MIGIYDILLGYVIVEKIGIMISVGNTSGGLSYWWYRSSFAKLVEITDATVGRYIIYNFI